MRTAILDCDSIAYSCGNGVKLLDEHGEPLRVPGVREGTTKFAYREKTEEELLVSTNEVMTNILKGCGADQYIAFIKGSGSIRNFRYDINPDYKANRKHETPSWWAFVKKTLVENWGAIEVDTDQGEVDDSVNITRLAIPGSFIVAIDQDLLGLEGAHYCWRVKGKEQGEWVTVDKATAAYYFWSDVITGQPGDNIKGLPGKGATAVEKLLSLEPIENYRNVVLGAYVEKLGEYEGIKEFYKNYLSLKLKETPEGFVVPTPVPFLPTKEEQVNIDLIF